jgi:3-deoxy-7-phosphoheptulonate synthase
MITREELLNNKPLIISGPCSVGSREQILEIAHKVKNSGGHVIRASLWKARTKPGSFQGVGEQGLEWLKEVTKQTGLPVTTEIQSEEQVEMTKGYADILWVGSRNMQNFSLLKKIAEDPRPVILKRGFISTIKEWLGAAEYIGLDKVIMCERGIRTGADSMRFTLDLNSALVAKFDHGLPVIIDPSHTAGRRDMVPHLARAGMAMGADGLIIEAHTNPDVEQGDKDQTVTIEVLDDIIASVKKIYAIVEAHK